MTGSEFSDILDEISDDIEDEHVHDEHSAKWWLRLLKEKLETALRDEDNEDDDDDETDSDRFGDPEE